jgi:hypothetical protein
MRITPRHHATLASRPLLMLAAAASIAVLSVTAPSSAQPVSGSNYEQQKQACRESGEFQKGLTGDALIQFVNRCVAEGSGTSSPTQSDVYEAKVQACRNQGADQQQLSGDALQAFVASCVKQ